MDRQPGNLRAAVMAALVAVAETEGVSLARLTAATQISLVDLADPDKRIGDEILLALWRLLAAERPGRSIGLELARRAPLSLYGPLAHGMRFARDLRQALDLLVELRHVLSARLSIEVRERDGGMHVVVSHPLDEHDGGHGAEFGLAVSTRFVREELGHDDVITAVHFRHRRIGPYETYEHIFGVPVSFEQPDNAVFYRRQALSRPNPLSDPAQFLFIKQHLTRVHATHLAPPTEAFAWRLRGAVMRCALSGHYYAGAVATELGLSVRTLQRRAREHQIDLRNMLEEVREATARALLNDDTLSIAQVAERAGYSTESAFRRAFKRWTGSSPAQVRRDAGQT